MPAAAGAFAEEQQQEQSQQEQQQAEPQRHVQQQAELAAATQVAVTEQAQQQQQKCSSCVASKKASAAERRRHPRRRHERLLRDEAACRQATNPLGAKSSADAGAAAIAELVPCAQSCSGQGSTNAAEPALQAAAAEAVAGEAASACKDTGPCPAGSDELPTQGLLAGMPAEGYEAAVATAAPPLSPPTPEPAAALPAMAVPAAALDAWPSAAAAAGPARCTPAAAEKPVTAARRAKGKLARVVAPAAAQLLRAPVATHFSTLQRTLALGAAILCVLLSIMLARVLPADLQL